MEVQKFLNNLNWVSLVYVCVFLDNKILTQSLDETCTVAVQAYNTDQDSSNLGLITLKKSFGSTDLVLSFKESTWKFYVWAIISASCYPVARGTYPLYRADGDLDLTSIRDQQALADALEAAVESAAQLQGVLVVASINGRGPFLGKMAEFASKYRITDTSEGDFFPRSYSEQDTLVLFGISTRVIHKYIRNGHGPQKIEYTFKHQDGEVFAPPIFRDLDQFDEETVGLLDLSKTCCPLLGKYNGNWTNDCTSCNVLPGGTCQLICAKYFSISDGNDTITCNEGTYEPTEFPTCEASWHLFVGGADTGVDSFLVDPLGAVSSTIQLSGAAYYMACDQVNQVVFYTTEFDQEVWRYDMISGNETDITPAEITDPAFAVAMDNTLAIVFVAVLQAGIHSMNYDGTYLALLISNSGFDPFQGIAVDTSRRILYWSSDDGSISSVPYDGTGSAVGSISVLVSGLSDSPRGIALDSTGDNLYVIMDTGEILVLDTGVVSPTPVTVSVALTDPNTDAYSLVFYDDVLYFTDFTSKTIWRVSLDGTMEEFNQDSIGKDVFALCRI